MSYTRGKWEADMDILENGEFRCAVLDSEGCVIATVDGYQGNGDGKESEANTKLIAAAPDMYEALKGLIETELRITDKDLGDGVFIRDRDLKSYKKALAKAEGKEL